MNKGDAEWRETWGNKVVRQDYMSVLNNKERSG